MRLGSRPARSAAHPPASAPTSPLERVQPVKLAAAAGATPKPRAAMVGSIVKNPAMIAKHAPPIAASAGMRASSGRRPGAPRAAVAGPSGTQRQTARHTATPTTDQSATVVRQSTQSSSAPT